MAKKQIKKAAPVSKSKAKAKAIVKKAKPAAPKKSARAAAPKKPAKTAPKKPARAAAPKKPPAPTTSARERGMSVDDYVARQGSWQQAVIGELREILREGAPGATEQIKWGQPVYDWNGPFAHIKAFSASVNLGFWRGATLRDPGGLLTGAGDRMKAVKITKPAAVNHAAFVQLVREAVRLNDELGDPTRR